MTPIERATRGTFDTTAAEMILPDCALEGAGDALAGVMAAIADGSQPLQHLPERPDCPFVVVQVRLGNRVDSPRGLREVMRYRTEMLEASRAYAHCIRTSSEGVPVDLPPDANAYCGLDLDMSRLADARIASRLGRDFPVFLREEDPYSTFDPRQHRAVIYSDLTNHEADLSDTAPSLYINAAIANGYELLGVETEWHACLDFLTPGPEERPVVLHLDFVLKRIDEPWAPIVWERLKRVHEFQPATEAKVAMFPPLHMQRTVGLLEQVGSDVGPDGWWHTALLMSHNREAMEHVDRAP